MVGRSITSQNAHDSVGWAWSPEEKERYANFLDHDAHLVAISSRHNRSKGSRWPEEWRPPDETLWCGYAGDWTEIKARWDPTMTETETGAEAVMEMLGACDDPPVVEVETLGHMVEGWGTQGDAGT